MSNQPVWAKSRGKVGGGLVFSPVAGPGGAGGGFHLSFHPNDYLLPRIWCFTWPRETQWWWASLKQHHIPQIQKRLVELDLMHTPFSWPSAAVEPATGISSSSSSSPSCCCLCFIFSYIIADWNVSPWKSKTNWINQQIFLFSCCPGSAWI